MTGRQFNVALPLDNDKKTFSLQIRFISIANAGMNAE